MVMKLKIISARNGETVAALSEGEHIVGRSHSAQIKVEDPDVSGKHLRITVIGADVIVENLSTHGTTLDGAPLNEPSLFSHGQCLAIGKSLRLFLLDESLDMDVASDMVLNQQPVSDAASSYMTPQTDNVTWYQQDIDSAKGCSNSLVDSQPEPSILSAIHSRSQSSTSFNADASRTLPSAPDSALTQPPGKAVNTAPNTSGVVSARADFNSQAHAPSEGLETQDIGFSQSKEDMSMTNVLRTRIASREEIEFLRDELDRLRAKTFPSFAHLHNKQEYPDE